MNKKYRIDYRIILEDASPIENKQILIDNCMSQFHAKVRLEDYLRRKYINFKALEVSRCIQDFGFEDIFGNFSDIFGGAL